MRDWFAAQARHFLEAQRAHMEAEERTFFPAAQVALTARDWVELAAQAEDRDGPLFGPEADDRRAGLRRHIEALSAAPD